MKRVLTPEWLDELPASDPRAKRSRADLRRVNACMGHLKIFSRLWREASGAPQQVEHIVDLGAGDGTFCEGLVRRLRQFCRVQGVTLVDRQPSVSSATMESFTSLECRAQVVEADALEWLSTAPASTLMFANLFLHHFRDKEIAELFDRAADCTSVFLAVEPRRSSFSLISSRLLVLMGCNGVTRHDAVASVRAGFSGSELGRLWPATDEWAIKERKAGWFSHSLIACRKLRKGDGGSVTR